MYLLKKAYPHAKYANHDLLLAAERNRISVHHEPIFDDAGKILRGSKDEALSIMSFVIGRDDAPHKIVFTNTIHGNEGFAALLFYIWCLENKTKIEEIIGSAIQLFFFTNINGWGASYVTRFDNKGIDPNRACSKKVAKIYAQFTKIYEMLDPYINPSAITLEWMLRGSKRLRALREKCGDEQMMHVMNKGQRVDPRKILYVGPSQCIEVFRGMVCELGEKIVHTRKRKGHIVHFDFHTCLGRSILFAPPLLVTLYHPASQAQARAKQFFGHLVMSTKDPHAPTRSSTGTIEEIFFSELPSGETYTGVCFELGTVDIEEVIKAMIIRHCVLNNGNWAHALLHDWWSRRMVMGVSYPVDDLWRSLVVPRIWPAFLNVCTRLTEGSVPLAA